MLNMDWVSYAAKKLLLWSIWEMIKLWKIVGQKGVLEFNELHSIGHLFG